MDEWWRSFFDQEYLRLWDSILVSRDPEVEAEGVVRLAQVEPPARLLDVPCGYGRVTAPLARLGFELVGVDLSPEMVAEARRRCQGLPVVVVEADMRELPVEGPFAAACCLFTSIGYTGDEADDLRFFRAVRQRLAPGAAFVIETMHRDRLAKTFVDRIWEEMDGRPLLIENQADWEAGTVQTTLRWLEEGSWRRRSFRVRAYTATEVSRLLAAAGWREVDLYGDWERAPLSPDTRLIAVAR